MADNINPNTSPPSSNDRGRQFRIRALAYVIDMLCLFVLNTIAQVIGVLFLAAIIGITIRIFRLNLQFSNAPTKILPDYIILIMPLLYFGILEWQSNSTLGKAVFGLRVLNYDGNRCSLRQALVRGVYRYIEGIVFGVTAYRNMTPPLYQRLGDKFAGTIVVNAKDPIIKAVLPKRKLLFAIILFLIVSGFIQGIIFLLINNLFFQ